MMYFSAQKNDTATRRALWLIAATCIALLAFALYLQHSKSMFPCPLCIIARYVYLGIALACIEAALIPAAYRRYGVFFASLVALAGVGLGVYHQWILANPNVTCGIDPLQTSLNKIWPATTFPSVFRADGMCSDIYPPILGLEIPTWSLVCFVGLAVILLLTLYRHTSTSSARTI